MRHLHRFADVTSTNDRALEMARAGAPSATVVIADRQTTGRGRQGRGWYSPSGCNLYASIIHRSRLRPSELGGLTLDVATAMATALEDHCGLRPQLKWPNDLLVSGRKIAGILTELHPDLEGAAGPVVVVGLGLNVNLQEEDLPSELQGIATSVVMESGERRSLDVLGELVARRVIEKLQGYEEAGRPDLDAYNARFGGVGRRVRYQDGAERRDGTIVGVGPEGELLVDSEAGDGPTAVRSGEVVLLEGAEA